MAVAPAIPARNLRLDLSILLFKRDSDAETISLTWPKLVASVSFTARPTLVITRSLPSLPTETLFGRSATELLPNATEFSADAVAFCPNAVAFFAVALASLPTAVVFSFVAFALLPKAEEFLPSAAEFLPY